MKRTRVKGRSDRNMVEGEIRKAMRDQIRDCQLGPVLEAAGLTPGCRGRNQGLHERRKAGQGGSKINPANLLGACIPCNGYIEDEPAKVRSATGTQFVVKEGDPEWEQLGRRADRLL